MVKLKFAFQAILDDFFLFPFFFIFFLNFSVLCGFQSLAEYSVRNIFLHNIFGGKYVREML